MMDYKFLSQILLAVLISMPIFFVAALVVKYQKRKLAARSGESVIDDPKALADAEAVANKLDVRKELTKNYSLFDNFSTMQGYNMNYMEKLVAFLSDNDVVSTYHFQEAMPAGVLTVTGATGTYELYIQRGQESAARGAIQRFRGLE